jgi:putative exosortase-associated protein (TIGR04073 family)
MAAAKEEHAMRTRKAAMVGVGAAILTFGLATIGMAQEESSWVVKGRMRKLGRGIANIATAPAELIRTPELVGRREGYLSAATVGVLQGAWRTVVRAAAGVFEVATFFVEVPPGYEPIFHPEFVWQHGAWTE